MLSILATKDELRAADTVAQHAELTAVLLTRLEQRYDPFVNPRTDKPSFNLTIELPQSSYELVDDSDLRVRAAVAIDGIYAAPDREGSDAGPEQPRAAFHVLGEFTLRFKLPSEPMPEEIRTYGIPAFARLNGPYLAWPYLRQLMHDLMMRSGVQAPPLPVLRVVEQQTPPPDAGVTH